MELAPFFVGYGEPKNAKKIRKNDKKNLLNMLSSTYADNLA